MQISLKDLLQEDHILIGIEAADAQDAIKQLTAPLAASGHVEALFADDTWQRELTFPTGLPTQPLAVAIPHADPDHVNRSAVCIGVLKSPVLFGQMGTDGSTRLEVRLLFMLAIKEKEKQVDMIRQLITLIQSGDVLTGLANAASSAEAMSQIRKALG